MRPGAHLRLVMLASVVLCRTTLAQTVAAPSVHYSLDAEVNDSLGIITGVAHIRYQHLVDDTLRSLTLFLGHNAFRPGSRGWRPDAAAREDDTGFQRVYDLSIDGAPALLVWPNAPDSTIAQLQLPRALRKADSTVITFRWLSRVPRLREHRQRLGRRIELVGWYPLILDESSRMAVRSPVVASHLVQLTARDDQIMGGTGVALCGDPGWSTAAASPNPVVTLQRDWYRGVKLPECPSSPGRKTVTWYGDRVGQMAYALSPTFRYEEGDFLGKPVRALYEKGQERSWGAGLATRRTEAALAWTVEIGGRFPWPHLTVIQSLNNGGEALPMLVLADNSAQSTIVHLVGLVISQQMLAGGTPMFTLGSAAFQTTWFFETLGRRGDYARLEREILDWDLDGLAGTDEPVATHSASTCTSTRCRRAEFMSHQLRRWANDDSLVRTLYNTVIDTFLLKPAPAGGFERFARQLVKPDPTPLYRQVALGGTLFDDALSEIHRAQQSDGSWRTTAVVQRRAAGLFPQTAWVIAEGDTAVGRATMLTAQETLTFVTRTRPKRVLLDPLVESHDWNMLNNQRVFEPGLWRLLAPHRPIDTYVGGYFKRRVRRDALTVGAAPTVWYNDAGGWTIGGRVRQDYIGRFELNELWASVTTEKQRTDVDGRLVLRNPVWLRATRWSEALRIGRVEGRADVSLAVEHWLRAPLADSVTRSVAASLHWLTVMDTAYVDPRWYDYAGTIEATVAARTDSRKRQVPAGIELKLAGGYAYANGSSLVADGMYARLTLSGSARRELTHKLTIGGRLFAGAVLSRDSVPRQRRIYLSGADPYEQFGSPFLRSRGSLLLRRGINYQQPGGAGVRALDPHAGTSRTAGATLELEYALMARSRGGLFRRIALAGFADGALANGDLDRQSDESITVADAGAGVRLGHHIGATEFQTRFDFPVWLSRPGLARADPSNEKLAYRFVFSFSPSF